MPIRYDENTKARAVRLVREHRDDYGSEWAAMTAISGRLGMSAETLRKWKSVHRNPLQRNTDAGRADPIDRHRRRRPGQRALRNHHRPVKTECVREGFPFRTGPIDTLADLENITSAWVSWYNDRRLMHRLGRCPPAEAEAEYYARLHAGKHTGHI